MRGRGRGFGDSSSGASFLRSSPAITWSGRSCLAGSLGGPAGKQGGKGGHFARRPFLPNFRVRQAFAAEAEALAGEQAREATCRRGAGWSYVEGQQMLVLLTRRAIGLCVPGCVCVCVCVRAAGPGWRAILCWEVLRPSRRPLEIRERWDEGQPGATPSSHDRRGHCSLCVVEVPSLGLLLGRDFGGVISFFSTHRSRPSKMLRGSVPRKSQTAGVPALLPSQLLRHPNFSFQRRVSRLAGGWNRDGPTERFGGPQHFIPKTT